MGLNIIDKVNSRVNEYQKYLESSLNYRFINLDLLKGALIHSSFKNEYYEKIKSDNERLEFIGDSVLDLIVSTFLYNNANFNQNEGDLTVNRSKIVKQQSLAKFAKMIDVDKFLITSKSGKNIQISSNESVLSDTFEAVVGAIYLDSSYDICEKTILDYYSESFIQVLLQVEENYKSMLGEHIAKLNIGEISYKLLEAKGPDHDKTFKSGVYINNILHGKGIGKTKRISEMEAAKNAMKILKNEHGKK